MEENGKLGANRGMTEIFLETLGTVFNPKASEYPFCVAVLECRGGTFCNGAEAGEKGGEAQER